jgi:hypothetical protein
MKRFLIFTGKIILITILISVVLDGIYTAIFMRSKDRGKIETVFNSKAENYDVVILGSSRANNHFIPQMFQDKGLKTFNYGMSAAHLFEASLMLKLMVERKWKIKNVIVEADLNLAIGHRSKPISSKFLPYISNSTVIRDHFKDEESFNEMYYIPFYRYIKYDSKIGFREAFFTLIHKKTNALENLGFYPLQKNKDGNMKNNIVNLNPLPHNKSYEEIRSICKANSINLIAVMTPMCENVKGMNYFDKVKKAYPEIYNYENAVTDDKYFSSCGHMSDEGAKIFTAKILKDFFNK